MFRVSSRWEVPNIPLLRQGGYDRIVDATMRPIMTNAVQLWSRGAKELTPVDTGLSRASIFYAVQGGLRTSQGMLRGVTGGRNAIPYLERGRAPGKMPPPNDLRGWAQRNLGDARLAFVVARAIGRKGLPAHRMFERTWQRIEPTVRGNFRRGLREIRQRLEGR